MHAAEIAEPYPIVLATTSALEAARLLAHEQRPGLVVIGADGSPVAVLPGSQVVRFLVPDYVQDDPALARVLGELPTEQIVQRLAQLSVAALLPSPAPELPVLRPDDSVVELAAVMARLRSPLAVVMDGRTIVGVVTAARLLRVVLGDAS